MRAKHGNWFVLAACALACVALGIFFHASRLRGAEIREQLAALHQSPPAGQTTPVTAAAETNRAMTTADQRELAERAALLEAARRVPEVARREAALREIKRIQAAHATSPPAPKPVPPPVPRDAQYFAELLDDPEYLQLVAQQWRMMQGRYTEQRLEHLGVAEDVRKKIVALEFDSYTARLDSQRYIRHDTAVRDAAVAASRKVAEENTAAIQEILGDNLHTAYRESRTGGIVVGARVPEDHVLEPLATRLSYSGSPLTPATRAQLFEVLQSMHSPGQSPFALPRTPEFIERARSVLQPGQIAALEELRAEYEAINARRRLPKSSELPRTTRRQRLEANTK